LGRGVLAALFALVVLTLTAPAHAADATFPTHPVRMIVPFPPGGATDIVARLVADKLAARWNQAVVVENKPGAGTIVGTSVVANAAPDGYTIGVAISAYLINPSLHHDLPYDELRDLTGVSLLTYQSMAVLATPTVAANDVPSMIALAKRTPGGLAFGTPGIGTLMHLSGELIARAAGIELNHLPYSGGGAAATDAIAGRIPLVFDIWFTAKPNVIAGKLKPIGFLDAKRLPDMPDVMTFNEVYPDLVARSSLGLVMRSATPRPLIDKISADAAAVIHSPELAGRLKELGLDPVGSTPAEYDTFIRREMARWKTVIDAKHIRLE
jgi:tripartite-type tricarboxylate transporter receptor subunit TctC